MVTLPDFPEIPPLLLQRQEEWAAKHFGWCPKDLAYYLGLSDEVFEQRMLNKLTACLADIKVLRRLRQEARR